ncbi:MAG: hypothetical protein Fur0021_29410 [Candidatus Promineifilaceae bacterium]
MECLYFCGDTVTEENAQANRSAALQAAQEKLWGLRQQRRQQRSSSGLPLRMDEQGRQSAPPDLPASPYPPTLPPHLGWHSQPVTQHLRKQRQPLQAAETIQRALPASSPPPINPIAETHVTLYPDLALAMLRQGRVAAGRIWLLLRHLDQAGKGWLSLAEARQQLTAPGAPWHVCGWRQLRNLLEQGDGVFWQRQNERIWLRSAPKAAAALGVAALNMPAVWLPADHLHQKIGAVRAHFYASFHSSRVKMSRSGRGQAAPIARSTLEKLSLITRHTQRRYEKTAGIRRQTNIAVGAPPTPTEEQARASQHGHALFHFTDHRGKVGRAGQTYLAWQLPNSYSGPHAQRAPGQRRRLNRQLAVLLHEGMTGNDKTESEIRRNRSQRRFFSQGCQAVRHYERAPDQDAYWPCARQRHTMWRVLPGEPAAGR